MNAPRAPSRDVSTVVRAPWPASAKRFASRHVRTAVVSLAKPLKTCGARMRVVVANASMPSSRRVEIASFRATTSHIDANDAAAAGNDRARRSSRAPRFARAMCASRARADVCRNARDNPGGGSVLDTVYPEARGVGGATFVSSVSGCLRHWQTRGNTRVEYCVVLIDGRTLVRSSDGARGDARSVARRLASQSYSPLASKICCDAKRMACFLLVASARASSLPKRTVAT